MLRTDKQRSNSSRVYYRMNSIGQHMIPCGDSLIITGSPRQDHLLPEVFAPWCYIQYCSSPATRSFPKGYYILYAVCNVNGLVNIVSVGPNTNIFKIRTIIMIYHPPLLSLTSTPHTKYTEASKRKIYFFLEK